MEDVTSGRSRRPQPREGAPGYNPRAPKKVTCREEIASMHALLLQDDAAHPRTPLEAEEALRFTQLLLDRAGEGAFWTDPEGRFFYVNEAACAMLGYSREELLALKVADTLPPEAGNLFQERAAKVRAGGPLTFEVVHVRKGGERLPAEVTLSYLEFQGRECYCAFARDITARKAAEAALRKSEERYHGLFEGVPVGLYRTTPAGRMLDANSTLVRILGYRDLESLLETQVGELYLDPEDRRRWQRAF